MKLGLLFVKFFDFVRGKVHGKGGTFAHERFLWFIGFGKTSSKAAHQILKL